MKAIIYNGQKVITTELLAQAYETTGDSIRHNFNRNKERFAEGKHFFYVAGEKLKAFKRSMTDSHVAISDNVNQLYLWTERGANRHSKILDTDKAWEQFENLEETYFKVKEMAVRLPNADILPYLNGVANYLRAQRTIMKENGKTPGQIAAMDKQTCEYIGLPLPEDFAAPQTDQLLIAGWTALGDTTLN